MNREEILKYVREKVLEARREQGGEALGAEGLRQLLKDIEYVQLRYKVAQQELIALNAWVHEAGRRANEEVLEESGARRTEKPKETSQWDAYIRQAEEHKQAQSAAQKTAEGPISVEAVLRDDSRVEEFFATFYPQAAGQLAETYTANYRKAFTEKGFDAKTAHLYAFYTTLPLRGKEEVMRAAARLGFKISALAEARGGATIAEFTSGGLEPLVNDALGDKIVAVSRLKDQPNGAQLVQNFWGVFHKVFILGMPEDAAVAVALFSAWPRARQEILKSAGAKIGYAVINNFNAAQEFLMAQPEGERLAQEHRRIFEGIKQKFGERVTAVSANASALLNCGLGENAVGELSAEAARLNIRVLVRRKPQGGGGAGGRTLKMRLGQRYRGRR